MEFEIHIEYKCHSNNLKIIAIQINCKKFKYFKKILFCSDIELYNNNIVKIVNNFRHLNRSHCIQYIIIMDCLRLIIKVNSNIQIKYKLPNYCIPIIAYMILKLENKTL